MTRQVLFIQGGSEGAYDADMALAESLRAALGPDYALRYPRMPNEEEPSYSDWSARIDSEVADMGEGAVLVGHSIGGSVLLRWLCDSAAARTISGAFAASAPFWHDDDFWRWDEARLPEDASAKLPPGLPLFLYQGRADDFVPAAHLDMYAKALPQAVARRIAGDHQLNEDLSAIAEDIRLL